MYHLKISQKALNSLAAHALKGFETKYKKEVGGHLLGYPVRNGFYVSKVMPYRTPYSTRTAWGINQYYFKRKGIRVETKRLKWIGTYHSHVEINRSASAGQSREDMEAHLFFDAPVDIIIRITTYRMRSPKNCLSLTIIRDGRTYYFDICGYLKDRQDRIKKMTVDCALKKSELYFATTTTPDSVTIQPRKRSSSWS